MAQNAVPDFQTDPAADPTALAIRMENITKRFPGVLANRGVHLKVRTGAFRAGIARIEALADRLRLDGLDLNARAERLSVAAGQKVEILKALYRGARILLLDEPTATLAPQEAETLFALLHSLVAAEGATVVL